MSDWSPTSDLFERGPVVMGLRLQHVTLGHLELLDELGIDLYGEITIGDLMVIAFVLAQSHQESRSDIGKWWVKPLFSWKGKRTSQEQLDVEFKKLMEWLKYQFEGPRVMRDLKKSGNQECAAPIHVNLISMCLSKLHLSLDEARSLTVKKAKQLTMAAAEAVGEVELVTDRYDRFIAMCNAADARMAAESRN